MNAATTLKGFGQQVSRPNLAQYSVSICVYRRGGGALVTIRFKIRHPFCVLSLTCIDS